MWMWRRATAFSSKERELTRSLLRRKLYILQKIRSSGDLCFQMCGLLATNPLTSFTASRTVPEIHVNRYLID